VGRVQGKDPIARVHIINLLARFNTPEVQHCHPSRRASAQFRYPTAVHQS